MFRVCVSRAPDACTFAERGACWTDVGWRGAPQAECAELQRAWIKQQTELVTVQNANQTLAEALQDQRASFAILEQKRMRIDQQVEAQQKEVRLLCTWQPPSAASHPRRAPPSPHPRRLAGVRHSPGPRVAAKAQARA